MNHRCVAIAVPVALATAALAGCASSGTSSGGTPIGSDGNPTNSGASPTSPGTNRSKPTTSMPVRTTAGSTPGPGGGRTMSAPHIVCYQNAFTMHYDGTHPHPVELCIRAGTAGRVVIAEPTGGAWPLPTASPAGVVATQASRSGRRLIVSVTATRRGTATLAVPGTSWRLEIAVA